MALVGPAFVLAIGIGFRISGDPMPEPIALALLPALVIFIAAIAVVALLIGFRLWPSHSPADDFGVVRRQAVRQSKALAEAAHHRLAMLDADPATRIYADRIRGGTWWSDEAIAYDRDPAARITCSHLQPIEAAMRARAIVLRPYFTGGVDAACVIDETRLRALFAVAPPVIYNDHVPGDRPFEPEGAVIACHEHGTTIAVVHPSDAKPGTPRFP